MISPMYCTDLHMWLYWFTLSTISKGYMIMVVSSHN